MPIRHITGKVRPASYLAATCTESLTCFLIIVIANDVSDAATEVLRKNVEISGFLEYPCAPRRRYSVVAEPGWLCVSCTGLSVLLLKEAWEVRTSRDTLIR